VSWPNRITIARLLMVPVFVMILLNASEHWGYRYGALGLALLLAAADAADGILARRVHATSRIGSILDPLADYCLAISAMVVLSVPGILSDDPDVHLPYWVSVTVASRAVLMLGGSAVIYFVCGLFRGLPSVTGKAATVMQFITVLVTIASPDLLKHFGWPAEVFLYGIWGITVSLAVISFLGYVRTGTKLLSATGHAE